MNFPIVDSVFDVLLEVEKGGLYIINFIYLEFNNKYP